MGEGRYITKKERDVKEQDQRLQNLLQLFGNFLLDRKGIKDRVVEKDLKDFADSLNK